MQSRALAGLALVLTVTAGGTTAWAMQSPNHGPVPTVTTTVSEIDTFPLWSGFPLQREWNQMRDVGNLIGEGATGSLLACRDGAPMPCLIDELPDPDLSRVQLYLDYLQSGNDAFLRALLLAPDDDEPLTPEEEVGANEAWEEYQRGQSISAEEAKRRLLG